MISNLVGNALQHGSQDGPVQVRLDGSLVDRVTLSVANHAEIPASILPILFDPFRTVKQRHERGHGLGLGLFISQEIVRRHGGTIDARSSGGETVMQVSLPRHAQ